MTSDDQEATAHEALTAYLAHLIRHHIGDNPDHSGPEDAAAKLAEALIEEGRNRLLGGDWREV
jgi:hypothetical protein